MRRGGCSSLSLALGGCLPKKSASLHVSPALEGLVPADTVMVLGFNFAALGDTAVYQKLSSRVPLPQLDEFQEQTGLDPRKDLSEFLLCSNGKNALLLARGKFRMYGFGSALQVERRHARELQRARGIRGSASRHHFPERFHGRRWSNRPSSML